MNYLELVQRVAQEAGISGTPSTAENLSIGDHKRIADWVNTAYGDIQRLANDWRWMRAEGGFLPWYPGCRSYRQAPAGGWTQALEELAAAARGWRA